jgi:hypothetical protein
MANVIISNRLGQVLTIGVTSGGSTIGVKLQPMGQVGAQTSAIDEADLTDYTRDMLRRGHLRQRDAV